MFSRLRKLTITNKQNKQPVMKDLMHEMCQGNKYVSYIDNYNTNCILI